MARSIRFKLRGYEQDIALAFERHCREQLDIHAPLDELVKRQFLKFLLDNIDRSTDVAVTGGDTAGGTDVPGAGPTSTGEEVEAINTNTGAVPRGD